jgi:hypothetical protein
MSSEFTAAPQALGYIYQIRYALFQLLSEQEDAEITIEKLEDISLEVNGSPYEILQLKHTQASSSLTNRSLELWKTLRIWSRLLLEGKVKVSITRFMLVSTSKASPDSIASLLKPNDERNFDLAYEKLFIEAQAILATDLKDDTLKKCCEDYLRLSDTDRKFLVRNIYILDCAINVHDIPKNIQEKYFTAIRREHRSAVYERLEGWWMEKVIKHLGEKTNVSVIARFEVEDKIIDIAEQFQTGALPVDFFDKVPKIPDNAEQRIFVIQLHEIELTSERIEKAIQDYYKAVEQRSRWARDELLFGDELSKFENRLVDEWERFSAAFVEELTDTQDKVALIQCGRKILNHMEFETDYLRIREKVSEPYIKRGSFHMLADDLTGKPRVWWHPLFMKRLETQLTGED